MYDLDALREELNRNEHNILVLQEALTKEVSIKQALNEKITQFRNSGDDPQDYETHLTSIDETINRFHQELDSIYAYNIKIKRLIAEIEAINSQ